MIREEVATKQLEAIITKLEIWQAKYPKLDDEHAAAAAKSHLMELLRRLDQ